MSAIFATSAFRMKFDRIFNWVKNVGLSRWTWLVLALGGTLRVERFFAGKDLWLDEAMLAWNIVTRDFAGLLRPLDLGQAAPAGYLWWLKAQTLIFGESEWALRLPSLLAGLGVLALVPYLCRKLCPENPWVAWWAAVGIAFNPLLLDLSNETKPYELDALAAILIMVLVLWVREGNWHPQRWVAAGAMFLVLPWFSFAVVFVLAGVGLTTLLHLARTGRWRAAAMAAVAFAASGVSFGVQYVALIRNNPVKDALLNMSFNQHYLQIKIRSMADLASLGDHAQTLFAQELGFPAAAAILSALIIALGAVTWVRAEPARLGWVAGPLLVAAGFSVARLYPFADRLLVFAAPGLTLLLAAGLAELASLARVIRTGRTISGVTAVALFASPVLWSGLRTVRPFNHEGITDVMRLVAQHPGAAKWLVVDASSTPTFNLYNRWRDYGSIAPVLGADGFGATWAQQQARFDALRPGTQFWLILPETYIGPENERRRAVDYLLAHARLVDSVEKLGSAAYLFELPESGMTSNPTADPK